MISSDIIGFVRCIIVDDVIIVVIVVAVVTVAVIVLLHVAVVVGRYTHPEGRGGFASVEHGKQFREAAYKLAGLNQPAPWQLGGAPHTITLMSAVTGEMVRASDFHFLLHNCASPILYCAIHDAESFSVHTKLSHVNWKVLAVNRGVTPVAKANQKVTLTSRSATWHVISLAEIDFILCSTPYPVVFPAVERGRNRFQQSQMLFANVHQQGMLIACPQCVQQTTVCLCLTHWHWVARHSYKLQMRGPWCNAALLALHAGSES